MVGVNALIFNKNEAKLKKKNLVFGTTLATCSKNRGEQTPPIFICVRALIQCTILSFFLFCLSVIIL